MRKNKMSFRVILGCFVVVFSSNVLAQWQWLDESGRKVFSDMPPPVSVPESRILAQPGRAIELAPVPVQEAAASHANAQKAQTTPAEKASSAVLEQQMQEHAEAVAAQQQELEALEKAQAAEREAVNARNQQIKAANCSAARRVMGQLESGRRATTTNARGEVVFMDEAARQQQRNQTQAIMNENC